MRDLTANQPADAKRAALIAVAAALVAFVIAMWLQSQAWQGAAAEPAPWQAIWPYWATFALLWLVLTIALARLGRWLDATRGGRTILLLLSLALLSRGALLVFAEPVLSDDIYRYLHEGALLAEGTNPYAKVPAAISAAESPLPSALARVNHPEMGAVYQPTAQYVFAGATWLHHGVTSLLGDGALDRTTTFRGVMVVFDVLIVLMLATRLREAGRSPWWAGLWALHPLVLSELAGSGHQDVIGICALLAGLLLFERANRRIAFAMAGGVALAVAVAVKPIAAPVAIPVAWWLRRWPKGIALTAVSGAAAMTALYLPFYLMEGGLATMLDSIQRFADHWRFNDSAHAMLKPYVDPFGYGQIKWRLIDWLEWADAWVFRGALQFLFADLIRTVFNDLTRYLLAATALVGMGLCLWRSEDKLFRPVVVYLLLMMLGTSTLHPWYVLWGLALLPLTFDAALWTLSATVALSYIAQHQPDAYYVPVWLKWLEFGPVYALAIIGWLTGWGMARPRWLQPMLPGVSRGPHGENSDPPQVRP